MVNQPDQAAWSISSQSAGEQAADGEMRARGEVSVGKMGQRRSKTNKGEHKKRQLKMSEGWEGKDILNCSVSLRSMSSLHFAWLGFELDLQNVFSESLHPLSHCIHHGANKRDVVGLCFIYSMFWVSIRDLCTEKDIGNHLPNAVFLQMMQVKPRILRVFTVLIPGHTAKG